MGKSKEEIRAGAKVFGQAANTLGVFGQAALKADDFMGKEIIAQNIIPSIVLKAFSCELFLKSLVTDEVKKVHKLNELFEHLKESDRQAIKSSVISKLTIKIDGYDETNFEEDLADVANAFVDWRYFYEEPRSIKMEFLNVLFDVLWKY